MFLYLSVVLNFSRVGIIENNLDQYCTYNSSKTLSTLSNSGFLVVSIVFISSFFSILVVFLPSNSSQIVL